MVDVKLTPLRRGDPRTLTVSVVDTAGVPINLSGSDWSSTVRATANSVVGTDLVVDVTQSAVGVLGLHLSGDQSRGLSNVLVGDLEGTLFGTILSFSAIVLSDVTRGPAEPVGGLVDNVTITWGNDGSTLTASVLAILVSGGGGGGGGVTSVNGNTGPAVVLGPADVGADPAGSAASVATTLGTAAAANVGDFATSAQGGRADTAVQPVALGTAAAANVGDFDPSGAAASAQSASQPLATVLTNTTASFTTAKDSKLAGIEALADVTDAANVAAAGAQMLSEKGAVSGYAGLDGTGVVPDGQLPAGLTRDSELTAAISAAINGLLDGAPGALDTLNELAASIGDDADFAGTVTAALAGKQPLDADLTAIAALTTTTVGRSLLTIASSAAGRTALGLVIGTDVQAFDSGLAAIAALATTAYGRGLLTLADQAALRVAVGTGTAAYVASTTFATSAQGTLATNAAPKASPALTGTPVTPTAATATNTAQIASTAFVQANTALALQKLAAGASVENIGSIEENVDVASVTGTKSMDISVYGRAVYTMTGNTTFSITNPAPSGKASTFVMRVKGTGFVPTLPASFKFIGTPPTYVGTGEGTSYVGTTEDGGTTYQVTVLAGWA